MDYFDFLAYLIMSGVQEKLVAELAQKMIELFERGIENPDRFATLTRLSKVEAMRIVANYNKEIPTATLRAFTQALEREDEQLNKLFENAFGKREGLSNVADNIANNAAIGMSEILRRQNIALADTQADIWHKVTAEAILREQSGEARKDVMERAVRTLARNSLKTIDYSSGRQTQIDSAIRRHLVSQANQARNRLLFYRMDEWECDLVFTSAHYGARPDHAEWQGKVYSRSGKSKKYPSLVDVTGYGTVTGLCGVNCRHTMTPYVEGYSLLPDTKFESQRKLTGMTNDESYWATQKQRRLEREIRTKKREIIALESNELDAVKEKIELGVKQEKLRKHVDKYHLTRDYQRERVWGIDQGQPRALAVKEKYRDLQKVYAEMKKDVMSIPGDKIFFSADSCMNIKFPLYAPATGKRKAHIYLPLERAEKETITHTIPQMEIDVKAITAGRGIKKKVELRKTKRLQKQYHYEHIAKDKWSYYSGETLVFDPVLGKMIRVEIHWAECPGSDVLDPHVKRIVRD